MVQLDFFIADGEDIATAATLSRVISKMTESFQANGLARCRETVRIHSVRTDGGDEDSCKDSGNQERNPDRKGLVGIGGIDCQRQERKDEDDAKDEAAASKHWEAHAAWS
jgi:hypothetical protein